MLRLTMVRTDDDNEILPGTGRWWTRLVFGALLLVASAIALAYLAARFVLWPNIDSFADRYAMSLQQRIGVPVAWRAIDSDWTGLRPSVRIDGLAIGVGDDAMKFERISGTLSLRQLLIGRTEFHDVVIDAPRVPLIRDGDRLRLAAWRQRPPPDASSESDSGFGGWLLQQPEVRIGSGTVVITDAENPARSLRFEQVSVVLRNAGLDHDLRVDIGQAGEFAASVTLQAQLDRAARADPADWRQWSGRIQTDARRLSVPGLLGQLPEEVRDRLAAVLPSLRLTTAAGRVDPGLTLQFDRQRLVEARLRLRGDDVSIPMAERGGRPQSMPSVLKLTRTLLDLRVVPGVGGGYELAVPQIDLAESGGARLLAGTVPILASVDEAGGLRRLSGAVEGVEIGPALTLARRLLDPGATDGLAAALRRASGNGRMVDIRFDWRAPTPPAGPVYSLRGAFERATLNLAPTDWELKHPLALRVPGIRNLSGAFSLTDAGGEASLRHPATLPIRPGPARKTTTAPAQPAEDGQITFGGALSEPDVPVTELDAAFSWRIDRAAGAQWLTMRVDHFGVVNGDGRIALSGTYRSGGKGSGVVDLRGRIERLQANRVWRYLPPELSEPVRRWVRDAFEAGTFEAVDARWRGDVREFPYRQAGDGSGQFRIGGKAKDVLFKYAPNWPTAHGVSGDLLFEGAAMKFTAERGSVLEVPLTGVRARIDDLADARLELDGRASGDAAQFLKFIRESPLADRIGEATRPLVAQGSTVLDLSLKVPLAYPARSNVAGRAQWQDGVFEHSLAGLRVDELAGRYEFTENSLTLSGLTGRYLGSPVEISGRTTGPGEMSLSVNGEIEVRRLRQLAGDDPILGHLKGASRYQATIDLARDGPRIRVESDLAGIASDLPSPMAKSVDTRWPFLLQLAPRPGGDRIDASLRGEILVAVERDRVDPRKPMQLARGALAFNRQPALPDRGVSLQYTGQRLDLDEWLAALAGPAGRSGPDRTRIQPKGEGGWLQPGGEGAPMTVSLVADEVRVAGRNFNKVVLGASRTSGQWVANLATREINGHLSWTGQTIAGGKLTARLGRLEIPRSQRSEAEALAAEGPSALPALDVTADRFVFGGLDFGALSLSATNQGIFQGATQASGSPARGGVPVWKIERLRLANPAAELEAQGAWNRSTSISYRLNVLDAGALLNRLQLKNVVRGGTGALSGQLTWDGSPAGVDLATLGGTVEIAVKDGQFLKVEPGAAKLIGVLNLQALPKLLTLDFKDIFAQGFAFDELRGTVAIRRGVATTDSLAMRGLQAVVQIRGDADLRAATQDLRVVVLPELNGGLATLAFAAIVNPAIGLGALLAQSVLSEPLSRAFAYEIDVTGSWADPTVVQRKRERFGPPAGSDAGR